MEISTKSGPSECLNRAELIKILSFTTKKLYDRISTERFRVRTGDPTYLSYVRALAQIAGALNTVIKDGQLEEIEERLDKLEGK